MAPTRQLHSTCTAVSGNGHTGNEINSMKLSSVCKSASQAVLGRIQPTLHATRRTPHRVSCLVQAMSAWSVKTRHAPSRYCRDARVYDLHTTAVHGYRVHPFLLLTPTGFEANRIPNGKLVLMITLRKRTCRVQKAQNSDHNFREELTNNWSAWYY